MNIYKLEYFLSVANYLSFTEAAKNLYISQPTLSRQIAELEDELGIKLFVRTKRAVRLTPGGEELLNYARQIVESSSSMVQCARKLQYHNTGVFRVGYIGNWDLNLVGNIVSRFVRLNPNANLFFERSYVGRLLRMLKSGELDAAVILSSDCISSSEIVWRTLAVSKCCVAVPPDHPFADRESVTIDELRNENFICVSRMEDPSIYDIVVALCNQHGFSPQIAHFYPPNIQSLCLYVLAGKGIGIVSGWINLLHLDSLRVIPISDPTPELRLCVAYLKKTKNPCLEPFLKAVTEEMAENPLCS